MTGVCETCGVEFTPRVNKANRFCSRVCTSIYARAVNSQRLKETALDRYWARVDIRSSDECWEWRGGLNTSGYGHVSWFGARMQAHRVAYLLNVGPIGAGLHVLHRCDNRPCCNHNHLFTGTQADNNADRFVKGRSRGTSLRGSQTSSAKLTEDDIRIIRSSPLSGAELARQLGVSKTAVNLAREGHTWRHVT